MIIAIIVSLLVGAVGGFVAGILVGRKNKQTVENVVATGKVVAADVVKVGTDAANVVKK